MAEKAYSTIGTSLLVSNDGTSYTKLFPIKTTPDLGGSPNMLETTDLDDDAQTFTPGVKQQDTMEFTYNYTPENFDKAIGLEDKEQHFAILLGADGAQGEFTFTGKLSTYYNGNEVDGVREATLNIAPSSKISFSKTKTVTVAEK